MIRLTLLTLAALLAVLVIFGKPDPNAPERPVAEDQPRPEPELPVEPEPEPEELAVPVVEVTAQAPRAEQRFPGPALRPSPEHQSGAEAAETELAPEPGATVLYVTGNRVNFRAGPSTNNSVVGALLGGSPVEALGPETAGWINIRDAQGRVGYMSAQFLSANRP